MQSRDFCFWLQGWFELNETIDHRDGASKETLQVIKNHLHMVFKHEIDPSMPDPTGELTAIHNSKPPFSLYNTEGHIEQAVRC